MYDYLSKQISFVFILKPQVRRWGLENVSNLLSSKHDYLTWISESEQDKTNGIFNWFIQSIQYKIYQSNKLIKKPAKETFNNYIYQLSELVSRGRRLYNWDQQKKYVETRGNIGMLKA